MGLRSFLIVIVAGIFTLSSWVIAPNALALTQIQLLDLGYQECPADLAAGSVSSGTSMPVNCFLVTGKAKNTSGKTVYDADVFGRIYDANNNPVMENRTRLGLIPEVPPGVSDFQIRISVAADQPMPLKLEQFKARGFASKVRWDQ